MNTEPVLSAIGRALRRRKDATKVEQIAKQEQLEDRALAQLLAQRERIKNAVAASRLAKGKFLAEEKSQRAIAAAALERAKQCAQGAEECDHRMASRQEELEKIDEILKPMKV